VLVLPKLSFDDFIRHQFQALIFVSFHQGKEKKPFGGQPRQAKRSGKKNLFTKQKTCKAYQALQVKKN